MIRVLVAGVVSLVVTSAGAHAEELDDGPEPRGSWGTGRIELGFVTTRIPVAPGDEFWNQTPSRLAHAGVVEAQGGNLRVFGGRTPNFYVGLDVAVLVVGAAPAIATGMTARAGDASQSLVRPNLGLAMTGGGIVGVQQRLGRLTVGAEGALGLRVFSLAVVEGGPVTDEDTDLNFWRLMLEARGRAEVQLSSHVSLSALAGVGVLRGEVTGAIAIAFTP